MYFLLYIREFPPRRAASNACLSFVSTLVKCEAKRPRTNREISLEYRNNNIILSNPNYSHSGKAGSRGVSSFLVPLRLNSHASPPQPQAAAGSVVDSNNVADITTRPRTLFPHLPSWNKAQDQPAMGQAVT